LDLAEIWAKSELGVYAYCTQIAQFALRIKAYFSGVRNLRCAFTKQFAFLQFALKKITEQNAQTVLDYLPKYCNSAL